MLETLECATLLKSPIAATLVNFQAVSTGTHTFDSEAKMRSPSAECHELVDSLCGVAKNKSDLRAEIDTSAPFESVKEATTRFGGFGFWKPNNNIKLSIDEDNAMVDEQGSKLEKDLIVREREALEVLEELERTKKTVEDLKLELQKEISDDRLANPADIKEEEKNEFVEEELQTLPVSILMDLRQTRQNLSQTRNNLSVIRASVHSYNKKLEKERTLVEKTRERLISNWSKIIFLEEQLNQTRIRLEVAKNCVMGSTVSLEKLKKMEEEVAKSEVSSLESEIEEMGSMIKTSELRLVAANKMKETDKPSEAFAVAESYPLSFKEYSSLTSKPGEAVEHCRKKVRDAMVGADETEDSKMEHDLKMENAAKEDAIMRRRPPDNITNFKNERDHYLYDSGVPVLRPSLSIGEILSRKLLASQEFGKGSRGGGKKVWLGQMLKGEVYGCHRMKKVGQ